MRALAPIIMALSLASSGCDKLLATVIGVGITTETPNPTQAQGLDSDLAAILPFNDPDIGLKQAVGSAVGLGERESSTSTAAPDPLEGASVKLLWPGKQVSLCPDADAPGSYAVTSVPGDACGNAALEYLDGVTYTTRVETSDDIYTMDVTLPPAINAQTVVFAPVATPTTYQSPAAPDITLERIDLSTLGSGLNVNWGTTDRNAFLTVVRINYGGPGPAATANDFLNATWTPEPGNPIFDNFPKDAGAMADLIINAPETSATVPATVFDTAGLYLLVLTPVEMSEVTSDNLMLGSGAFAGVSTIFAFWVD